MIEVAEQHNNVNDVIMKSMTLYDATKLYGGVIKGMWQEHMYTERFKLESRRYIGCKAKLVDWIFDLIDKETEQIETFCDIFAGTGTVAHRAIDRYNHIYINDFLYSNNLIYKAFFGVGQWDQDKIYRLLNKYNYLNASKLEENYFSKNFGGKFFDNDTAKIVGYIREDLRQISSSLTEKEYAIMLASLIYSIDRLANTLGHFDAYMKKSIKKHPFVYKMVDVQSYNKVEIFKEDANKLSREIHADLIYIDPPYNSRQYSRFYHVYENLVQWKKPKLFGVAMKPKAENMSNYCRVSALTSFVDLVAHLDAKYLVVSYNNTYNSKSKSSANKITLKEIENVLSMCGETRTFSHSHLPFNSGKTEFDDHKEYLFITKIDNEKRNNAFSTILRG